MGRWQVLNSIGAGFGLAIMTAMPALAAEITWTVDHPFRFLRFQSDHAVHELAHAAAKADPAFRSRPVSAMEARLNDPAWWSRPVDGDTPRAIVEALRSAEGRSPERLDLRLGWSSLLRSSEEGRMGDATCWDSVAQSYRGCRSDAAGIGTDGGYIEPQHHYVTIRIAGAAAGAQCTLAIDTPPSPGYGFLAGNAKTRSIETAVAAIACADAATLRIPYGASFTVSGDADGEALSPVEIKVRDIMIASIGDSFASGEGNPDLPAVLDDTVTIRPRFDEATGSQLSSVGVPRRKARPDGGIADFSSARWLDRRCHRSMYSAHTRSAIALALAGDRHHAVTYVSYACSGAEVTDGLFWPQDGRECISGSQNNYRFMEPQISALVGTMAPGAPGGFHPFPSTLEPGDRYRSDVISKVGGGYVAIRDKLGYCAAWPGGNPLRAEPQLRKGSFVRDIDLLLLGIGGNDMGFSKVVTSVVLTNAMTPIFDDLMGKVYAMAAGGISMSEANADIARLDGRYAMLASAIRSKLEIDDPSRVVITGYPSPAFGTDKRLCDSARRGMNASRLFNMAGPNSSSGKINIRQAQQLVENLNRKIEALSVEHGFTYVRDHIERFKTHGLCATDGTGAPERLDLPHKTGSGAWQVFNPTSGFQPYAKRQRWFRTFNDSYMLMYHYKTDAYQEKPTDSGNAIFLALRTLGGPVHPTAEGHAAMADSIYCAAAAKLFDASSSARCQ